MIYLTSAQVLFIHARLIAETGGTPGIRDLGLLASAVARPRATFAGQELYVDIFVKTAALMESLVNNHPFVDGNKRVGIAASGLFLLRNDQPLKASSAEIELFTMQVAQGQLTLTEMTRWFEEQS